MRKLFTDRIGPRQLGDVEATINELRSRARNALLTEMTDEVARLVLRNNYWQTLALSLAERHGTRLRASDRAGGGAEFSIDFGVVPAPVMVRVLFSAEREHAPASATVATLYPEGNAPS